MATMTGPVRAEPVQTAAAPGTVRHLQAHDRRPLRDAGIAGAPAGSPGRDRGRRRCAAAPGMHPRHARRKRGRAARLRGRRRSTMRGQAENQRPRTSQRDTGTAKTSARSRACRRRRRGREAIDRRRDRGRRITYGYRLWAGQAVSRGGGAVEEGRGRRSQEPPRELRAEPARPVLSTTTANPVSRRWRSTTITRRCPMANARRKACSISARSLMKLDKPADACKVYTELTDVYGTKISAVDEGGCREGTRRRQVPIAPDAPEVARFAERSGAAVRRGRARSARGVGWTRTAWRCSHSALSVEGPGFRWRRWTTACGAGSAQEATMVAAVCAGPRDRSCDAASGRSRSKEPACRPALVTPVTRCWRIMRGQVGAAAIATAHHVDDQAETLLMRAGRGAGLSGMAGITPLRSSIEGVTGGPPAARLATCRTARGGAPCGNALRR